MENNNLTIDDLAYKGFGEEEVSPSNPLPFNVLNIDSFSPSPEQLDEQILLDQLATRDYPTAEEKFREAGIGAAVGTIEGGSTFGGAIAGARAAAALTPPVLPGVGPFAKPIAATLGFGAGFFAGHEATKDVASLFPEVSRQDLVPYREGGKTFGQSIGAAPIAFGIPLMQGGRIAQLVSGIGETARRSPRLFLSTEVAGGTGAGVAGGFSESTFPGQALPRAGAEVVGGFFSPTRLLLSGAGVATNATRSLLSTVSPAAQEARASSALFKILDDPRSQTDVPALIKALEENLPSGIKPTAAQKTGSKALSMLETTLARGNAKYGGETVEQGQDAFQAYELLIENLREIGSPTALAKVAQLRAAKTEALLTGRLELANRLSADKIRNIRKDTAESRGDIGQIVRSETERALADVRTYENQLYEEAYKASVVAKKVNGKQVFEYVKVRPTNTAEAFLDMATSMTPERLESASFKPVVSMMGRLGIDEKAINRYAQGKLTSEFLETGVVPREYLTKVVTEKPAISGFRTRSSAAQAESPRSTASVVKESNVKDLQNIRSDILAFTRQAAADGKTVDTHFLGKLAEAALDDLDTVSSPAYKKATQFSRAANDFFSRTYASEIKAVNKAGAEKLPAEVLVAKAFSGGADVTAMRMNDIEQAVGMMATPYNNAVKQFGINSSEALELKPFADAAKQRVVSIQDAETRVMLLAATKAVDPNTGRINLTSLQRFVNENETVLRRLNITEDLQDVVKAENAFKALATETSHINERLAKQTAFARVLQFESPTAAIADALNGRYPVKSFNGLVRLAKSGGPEAVEGLKASMFDYVFTKAGKDNRFSPAAFDKAFFDPIALGQPSIHNILRSQGVMSATEVNNLNRLITPMANIELALQNRQITDDIVQGADAVTELFLRAKGAQLGSAVSPGGSLIAASAGSKFLRQQFDKMPMFMVKGIIEEATKDPQMMALLLKRGTTQRNKLDISRQIHAYTVAAGLNYADADNEPMPAEEAPRTKAKGLLQRLPTVQTRGTVVSSRPAMPAPGGASGPPAPVGQGTSSRKMLQSLFPRDDISAME
jgi:uncharacterized protein YciW